ncbi:Aste57867_16325 [Aphanomyces stellatus]|uniref:Aste57867_16325 protein n=1 Tax=Aphanomyces stellatus TaxID=120398 RepID=A0A485L604_9STRA|nr:hypothetical protein As57867_016268 [Aphanomyces stellatus]VFT93101.1 Aste57867_16325 [Aphanomyces stellatus]
MKIRAPVAVLASLWSPTLALSEDWFDDAMKQSFPHVQSVMSIVLTKPDPCEVAVASMQSQADNMNVLEEMFESLFPDRACRGQVMFSPAEEEECLAVQSSPEIEEMRERGIDTPALVCGWRKFWVDAKSNDGMNDVGVTDSCELCERTVTMIENTFDKQALALEIVEEALKVLCDYLPESTKCKVLETNFDAIVDWLKQGLSPHNICIKISMCTAQLATFVDEPVTQTGLTHLRAAQDDELCAICRDNASSMRTLVNVPLGLQLYKDSVDSICALVPETKSCQFMSTHIHKLASHLKRGDDVATTCRAVRACASEVATAPTYLGCAYCEFVGHVVTSALHQGGAATLPVVKMEMQNLCSNLPAAAQCSVMDAKFDDLAAMMSDDKSPQAGCEAINMCSPLALVPKQTEETQMGNLLAVLDKLVVEMDTPYNLTHEVACTTCEHTAYAIERVEKSHKESLPVLKKTISNLCHFLPPCTKCRDIVNRFDDLVALVDQGLQAKPACVKLGFCKPELASPALVQLEAQVKALVDTTHKTDGEVGCMFCQYTAEMIAEVAKYSKDVVPLLKMGVETLCTRLPQEAKCDDVVAAFDNLADLVDQGKTALEACQHEKLCDAHSDAKAAVDEALHALAPALSATTHDDVTCTMCEAAARAIDSIAKIDKEYIFLLKIGLGLLCDRFQTPQCASLMPEFDHLADLVESGKNYLEACDEVKLCDTPTPAMALAVRDVNRLEMRVKAMLDTQTVMEDADVVSCLLCQYTGQMIGQVAQYDKDIVPVLKQGMETLCSRLPVEAQCDSVLAQFDTLAELIEAGTSPSDACSKVQLCGAGGLQTTSSSNGFLNMQLSILKAKMESLARTQKKDIVSCFLCEDAAELILAVAQYDKEIVPFLKVGIQALCSEVPQLQAQCNSVDKFDDLTTLVEAGTNPSEACAKVQLCDAAKNKQLALVPTSDSFVDIQVATLKSKMQTMVRNDQATDIVGCLLCEDVGQLILAVSQYDKEVVPFLKVGIQALCSEVPQLASQCNAVVDKFDELMSLIEGGTSPSAACGQVQLCEKATKMQLVLAPTSKGFVRSQVAILESKMHALVHDDQTTDIVSCLLCEDVAQLILAVAQYDKEVVPFLKVGIQALCSEVPQLATQCNAVVDKFDDLLALVEGGTRPSDACAKVQLCDAAKKSLAGLESHVANLVANPKAAVDSEDGCLFCQYASEAIGVVAKVDKAQLPAVREAIGAMCSILPPSVHCDDVMEHFDQLAKLAEGGMSALDACQSIALCDAPKPMTTEPKMAVKQALMKLQVVIDEMMAVA